jgi:hypothetical protein
MNSTEREGKTDQIPVIPNVAMEREWDKSCPLSFMA